MNYSHSTIHNGKTLDTRTSPAQEIKCSGLTMGHLLVPTWMSEVEIPALELALELAIARQSRLTVLYIFEPIDFDSSNHWLDGIERLYQALDGNLNRAYSTKNLEQNKSRLRQHLEQHLPADRLNQIDVQLALIPSTHPEAIVKFANDHAVDTFVLVGGVARSSLPFSPSTIQKLLRSSKQQILLAYPARSN